jgi:hypothetical protein
MMPQVELVLAEEPVEALVTVGLVALLLEGPLVQLLETKAANKMLRMKLSEHGSNASPRYGLMAASTEGAPECMVVSFAVGMALVLEEGSVMEGGGALLAHKTTRVPLEVQGGDVVLGDGSMTSATLGGKLFKVANLAVCRITLLVKSFLA